MLEREKLRCATAKIREKNQAAIAGIKAYLSPTTRN
jgi:hypothetical protein